MKTSKSDDLEELRIQLPEEKRYPKGTISKVRSNTRRESIIKDKSPDKYDDEEYFTPLKIYNKTPEGGLNRDLKATLLINKAEKYNKKRKEDKLIVKNAIIETERLSSIYSAYMTIFKQKINDRKCLTKEDFEINCNVEADIFGKDTTSKLEIKSKLEALIAKIKVINENYRDDQLQKLLSNLEAFWEDVNETQTLLEEGKYSDFFNHKKNNFQPFFTVSHLKANGGKIKTRTKNAKLKRKKTVRKK